ncbi:FtsB family cell division protein [Romboutsia sp. 13368]|uniref:FtsB family cell division protein n=1 Tax=Romboutsia sp. 13368 TaxID=2708053 RepID=UPI0025DC4D2A|nr:septum formation initiator family protein [Romboutsia sp. 13368]
MNIRKKFSAQFILVSLFIIFVIYTVISGFVFQITKLNEYKSEISSLNEQISTTKKEIEKLKKIENGNTEEDLETIARNRLNMVKPNEIIYIDIGKEGN